MYSISSEIEFFLFNRKVCVTRTCMERPLAYESCINSCELMRNYYDAITAQINAGLWEDCMAMFDRAWTLDFYYRLYCLVLKYEPRRAYGYQRRIVFTESIISQMGGAYNEIEPYTVAMAVKKMEAPCEL